MEIEHQQSSEPQNEINVNISTVPDHSIKVNKKI
jgi:hypothetical protein